MGYEDDQQAQQDDREQLLLDCLMNCYKHGLEGTAGILAGALGLSKQWDKAKPKERIAA